MKTTSHDKPTKAASKERKQRVVTLLNREQLEFLDRLSKDAQFSTGHKLSRMDLISGFVDVARRLGLSVKGVQNRDDLVERFLTMVGDGLDTRKFPRLAKRLHVALNKIDSMSEYSKGMTENIGLGGFKIRITPDKVPALNEVIEISLRDSHDPHSVLKVFGKVIWLRSDQKHKMVELGLALTHVNKVDEKRLKEYLADEHLL